MDFANYQELAGRTVDPQQSLQDNYANFAMGLSGEAGELVDLLKKELFHGREATQADFESEAGDVLWYLANLCRARGISLQRVAENNLVKLHNRYPDGFVKGGGNR